MNDIFEFIEETGKKLSRPIKDLDDIRLAMLTLKDVREKEISIDMQIGPIEVNIESTCLKSICKIFVGIIYVETQKADFF